jgi:hypothetical protein
MSRVMYSSLQRGLQACPFSKGCAPPRVGCLPSLGAWDCGAVGPWRARGDKDEVSYMGHGSYSAVGSSAAHRQTGHLHPVPHAHAAFVVLLA